MHYSGIRTGAPEVLARLDGGQAVDPAEYYFRIAIRFETGAADAGLDEPGPRASASASGRRAGRPTTSTRCREAQRRPASCRFSSRLSTRTTGQSIRK